MVCNRGTHDRRRDGRTSKGVAGGGIVIETLCASHQKHRLDADYSTLEPVLQGRPLGMPLDAPHYRAFTRLSVDRTHGIHPFLNIEPLVNLPTRLDLFPLKEVAAVERKRNGGGY